MRRWLWPYAILAAVLSLVGIAALLLALSGSGGARAMAQLSVVNVVAIEPLKNFFVSMLEMIAPFDIPTWVKDLYATLGLIAVVGIILSAAMGMLLLPVFYVLYRQSRLDENN
ncbi:MAG: hypothetical protein K8S25_17570 [Alphaproteobacteria bacterium]|nr:hypothetical protein [Alphaproteobacteria bacterium]